MIGRYEKQQNKPTHDDIHFQTVRIILFSSVKPFTQHNYAPTYVM